MKKSLKYLTGLLTIALIWSSCGSEQSGQLLGVQDRPEWNGINPYGMVYIPSGTVTIGQSGNDKFDKSTNNQKTVSIQGFYMDDTEITNNEYRQFVNWVQDSIAHVMLDHYYEDAYGNEKLDWQFPIDWNDPALEELYVQGDDYFASGKKIDKSQLVMNYQWIDWQKAAHNPDMDREEYIHQEAVEVYPDTMSWIRDFSYSYNEPMTRNYFWHPAFDDYPVVGVNWKMARAFCFWRTLLWNKYNKDEPNTESFRLPTEWEWEYAARGGHDLSTYPWGSYYLRNSKGCLLANFKPGRGDYPEDGGMHTVTAYAYFPNDYGLYNMAGNVAEWTSSAYYPNSYAFSDDLNPDIKYDAKEDDPKALKRKTIRGGSWKDVGYYLQNGARTWEYQDTSKSYIGFRCALTFLGRSVNDF